MLYLSYSDSLKLKQNQNSTNAIKSSKKQKLSFGGHDIVEDSKGNKSYRFFLPNGVDSSKAKVEIARLDKDPATGLYDGEKVDVGVIPFDKSTNEAIFSPSEDKGYIKGQKDQSYAYRFIIDGKPYNGPGIQQKTDDGVYNIANDLNSSLVYGNQSYYQVIPQTVTPADGEKTVNSVDGKTYNIKQRDIRRTHFNAFGGKLSYLTNPKFLDYVKEMGFHNLLCPPIFGQDNRSDIGYWTTNGYQITSKLGDMGDFENLQKELYKRGMNFVSDGAFVNEGLEGIHLQDALHYEDSPYRYWFPMTKHDGEPVGFGVLPVDEKAVENYDIKVVNSPINCDVDKNGYAKENFGRANKLYDPAKPTYIQLYDRRTTSKEQLKSNDPIKAPDIPNLDDPKEIKDALDSVHCYKFPVSPNEIKAKVQEYEKEGKNCQFKEKLQDFKSFSLKKTNDSSVLNLWCGSNDVAKLRFMLSAAEERDILAKGGKEELNRVKEGIKQVEDYVVGIGKFWTRTTANVVNLQGAKQLDGNDALSLADDTAESKAVYYKNKIKEGIKNNQLPQKVEFLTADEDKTIENLLKNDFNLKEFKVQPFYNIEDALKAYPLAAIEFDPNVSSVISSPLFQARAQKELYNDEMKKKTIQVLRKLDEKDLPGFNFLNSNGEFNSEAAEVYSLISDDITKFLIAKSLSPSLKDYNDPKELSTVTMEKLGIKADSHKEAVDCLFDRVKKGLGDNHRKSNITEDDIEKFASELEEKIKGVTPEAVKVSKLITDRAQAGLNWRIDAAKDVKSDDASPAQAMDGIKNFWSKFNAGIDLYNKHALKIGEVTDEPGFLVDPKVEQYSSHAEVDRQFLEMGFNSIANYTLGYSTPIGMFSAFAEPGGVGNGYNNAAAAMDERNIFAWDGMKGSYYLFPTDIQDKLQSIADGCHDKISTLHVYSLDAQLAYCDNISDKFSFDTTSDLEKTMRGSKFYSAIKDLNDLNLEIKYNDALNKLKDTSISAEEREKNEKTRDDIEEQIFITDQDSETLKSKRDKKATALLKDIPSAALAKESAILGAINDAVEKNENYFKNESEKERYLQSFIDSADDLATASNNGEFLAIDSFENNWADIIGNIKDSKAKDFFKDNKQLMKDVQGAFLGDAFLRHQALSRWQVLAPGAANFYYGGEVGRTGAEQKSKNPYNRNRERPRYEYLLENDPDCRQYCKDQKAQLSSIFSLRNQPGMSCLSNGPMLTMKPQAIKGDGVEQDRVRVYYRYNNVDDVIAIQNNNGFNPHRHFEIKPVELEKVDLSSAPMEKHEEFQLGIPFKLKEGTTYINAENPNDKTEYVIDSEGNLVKKGGGTIKVDTDMIFLKRKPSEKSGATSKNSASKLNCYV